MFGLFKPRQAPVGPHPFEIEGEIAASAADVFAMLDFADPRNALKARGATITPVEGPGRRFVMRLPRMDDLSFHIDVIEAEAPNHYAYAILVDPLVGRMAASTESYTVWDIPGGGCRVRLENAVTFQEGLLEKHVPDEFAMVTMALVNSMTKLKLHAEQGAEAVLAYEAEQYGCS